MPRPKRTDLELLRVAAELWDAEEHEIGYLARLFAQTSLPYRDPGDVPAWGRRNGNLVLVVQPGMTIDKDGVPRSIGYPFGTVPRLVLTWLSTEAVRTKSRDLVLGESLAEFMRSLELTPTGGRNGTITRLRRQMERLFQATLSARWEGDASREAFCVSGAYQSVGRWITRPCASVICAGSWHRPRTEGRSCLKKVDVIARLRL